MKQENPYDESIRALIEATSRGKIVWIDNGTCYEYAKDPLVNIMLYDNTDPKHAIDSEGDVDPHKLLSVMWYRGAGGLVSGAENVCTPLVDELWDMVAKVTPTKHIIKERLNRISLNSFEDAIKYALDTVR